jgi:hypothetical protein
MDQENVVHPYNEILLGCKKELSTNIVYNMDDP